MAIQHWKRIGLVGFDRNIRLFNLSPVYSHDPITVESADSNRKQATSLLHFVILQTSTFCDRTVQAIDMSEWHILFEERSEQMFKIK